MPATPSVPTAATAGRALVLWLAALASALQGGSSLDPTWRDPLAGERALAEMLPEHWPRPEGDAVLLGPSGARIEGRGLVVEPRDGCEVSIALARLGRAGAMRVAARPVAPRTHGAEVRIERVPGVTEWWRSLAGGLEHGVTIDERPPGAGRLRLELALDGGVRAEATDDPDALSLRDAARGRELARYAGLYVVDARGARLAGRLLALGDRIGIEVDDDDARYPVIVDPLLSLVREGTIDAADVEATDMFGADVAVSGAGDVALVGAPGDAAGTGTVRVFVRGAGSPTWTQDAVLSASAPVASEGLGRRVALSRDGSRAAAVSSGRVVVFARSGASWSEHSVLSVAAFPSEVALDRDGSRILLGFARNPYAARWTGTDWSRETIDVVGPTTPGFGRYGAFSPDGTRIIISESDPGTSIGRIYALAGTTWTGETLLPVPSGLGPGETFGRPVAFATDRVFLGASTITAELVWSGSAWTAGSLLPCASVVRVAASTDGTVFSAASCVLSRSGSMWERPGGAMLSVSAGRSVPTGDAARVLAVEPVVALGRDAVNVYRLEPGGGPGATCATGTECMSGDCRAGVCCEAGCGACGACDASGTCSPLAAGTACRPARDECDAAEVCDGAARTCPADATLPEGASCAFSGGGPCFTSAACARDPRMPPDAPLRCTPSYLAEGTPCVPASPGGGTCAAAAACGAPDPEGASDCVATSALPGGTPCRPATDTCDAPETCDGTTAVCPPDVLLTGVVCRPAAGACDSPEVCFGTSASCPADSVQAAGIACRASADLSCDPIESCDGTSMACPADVSSCAPGLDGSAADAGPTTMPPAAVAGCACRTTARSPSGVVIAPAMLLLCLRLRPRRSRLVSASRRTRMGPTRSR